MRCVCDCSLKEIFMRIILAVFATLVLLCSSVSAQPIKASLDGTDSFHPYFGIWKGEWYMSGTREQYNRESRIFVCIGPQFTSKGGGEFFGWMNSIVNKPSSESGRKGTILIRELSLDKNGLTFDVSLSKGTQYASVKLAGDAELSGKTYWESQDHTLPPHQGRVTLTKVKSLGGAFCPPSFSPENWPY